MTRGWIRFQGAQDAKFGVDGSERAKTQGDVEANGTERRRNKQGSLLRHADQHLSHQRGSLMQSYGNSTPRRPFDGTTPSRDLLRPFDVPQELFPVQHRFLELDCPRIHYVDEGAGESLLLLHGNPSWCFLYRKIIAAFREAERQRFERIFSKHKTVLFDDASHFLQEDVGDRISESIRAFRSEVIDPGANYSPS
jgi:hypothetical protein